MPTTSRRPGLAHLYYRTVCLMAKIYSARGKVTVCSGSVETQISRSSSRPCYASSSSAHSVGTSRSTASISAPRPAAPLPSSPLRNVVSTMPRSGDGPSSSAASLGSSYSKFFLHDSSGASIARPALAADGVRVTTAHFAAFAPVPRVAAVVPFQQNHRRVRRRLLFGKIRQILYGLGEAAARLFAFPCHADFSRSMPSAAPTVFSGRFRPRQCRLSLSEVSRGAILKRDGLL